MNDEYIKKYEPFFKNWYLGKKIGEGSFGSIYEIEKEESGITQKAALKTITVPQSDSEIKRLISEGMTNEDIAEYYESVVRDVVNEYILMSKLKDNTNIASYEDHLVVKHENNMGYDILIRMELLTGLPDYCEKNGLTKRNVIKLGIDICNALDLCHRQSIVHRDVRPENIFVSMTGDYKLGGFGKAETAGYGSGEDIYSLGIVMYELLNNNRFSFFPDYTDTISADGKLAEIVLKACAHDPEDRYQTASEMKAALEEIDISDEEGECFVISPNGGELTADNDIAVNMVSENDLFPSVKSSKDTNKSTGRKVSRAPVVVLSLLIIAAAAGAFINWYFYGDIKDIEISMNGKQVDNDIQLLYGDTETPEYIIKPERLSKRNLEFSVTDEDIATVSDDGALAAKSVGDTELTIKNRDFEKSVRIKVVPKITDIKNIDPVSIFVGDTYELEPLLKPSKYSGEKISYSSKNTTVAKVSKNGLITGLSAGETTIIVKAGGLKKTVKVSVEERVVYTPYVSSNSNSNVSDSEAPKPETSKPKPSKPKPSTQDSSDDIQFLDD